MKRESFFDKYPFLNTLLKSIGVITVIVGCSTFVTTLSVKADNNEANIKDKVSSKEMSMLFDKIDERVRMQENYTNIRLVKLESIMSEQQKINNEQIKTNTKLEMLIQTNTKANELVGKKIDKFANEFVDYRQEYFSMKKRELHGE